MSGGVLLLLEPHDQAALWAARGLAGRLDGPVDVVTAPVLGSALRWVHRLRGDLAEVEVALADGRRISGAAPRPVLNRLSFAPVERLRQVGGEDVEYAVQEFQAFFLSWLTAMPGPMLNRPSPQFLGGHWRAPTGWAMLAARAGLPTTPIRRTVPAADAPGPAALPEPAAAAGDVPVFVLGEEVIVPPGASLAETPAEIPAELVDACRRLGRSSGDALLGITLRPPDGDAGWTFAAATPMPDLRLGGEPLLDALAGWLKAAA